MVVILLMGANWSLEALKWQVLVRHVQTISFWKSFRAILSGLSVSLALNTPNGSGEYIGRILYVKQGNRIRVIALTLVGSISQLLVTIFLGSVGIFILRQKFYNTASSTLAMSSIFVDTAAYISVLLTLIMSVIFFKISWLTRVIEKIPFVQKYAYYIRSLEEFRSKELMKVLMVSLARYGVFIVQYVLVLQIFNVNIELWNTVWLIAVMFLALAIVPTIALAEIGVRGQISIILFGVFSSNSLGIVLTASAIWLINLVVPALAGSLFILGIKIFRNK